MRDVLVRGEGLTRVFGTGAAAVSAIDDATFEIEAGRSTALVGPSGSGKSTLLHLIAALDRPTSGTIEWPGLGAVRSRAEETGAALLVATHDPDIAERLDARWSLADRRLETGVVLRSA